MLFKMKVHKSRSESKKKTCSGTCNNTKTFRNLTGSHIKHFQKVEYPYFKFKKNAVVFFGFKLIYFQYLG